MTTVRAAHGARLLTMRDRELIEGVLDDDPVTNVFLDARIRGGLGRGHLAERLAAYTDSAGVTSLCWLGGNVVPTANAGDEAADAFSAMARRYTAWFSSLWGPIGPVSRMFERLQGQLDEPRAVRPEQPFMVLRQAPLVPPDPLARVVTMADFDAYYAASVAFFTEELGVSPERDGSSGYRVLVADLVKSGRAYARFERGRLTAKADVALVGSAAAQLQGVYVVPERRGEGLAGPMVAAACAAGLQLAPVVTLYVNAFNEAARRAYVRVGFAEHATFRTYMW
jgi:ribosomal protein S18 acetylase RimI-like enzyme